jgi:hypothetical protein
MDPWMCPSEPVLAVRVTPRVTRNGVDGSGHEPPETPAPLPLSQVAAPVTSVGGLPNWLRGFDSRLRSTGPASGLHLDFLPNSSTETAMASLHWVANAGSLDTARDRMRASGGLLKGGDRRDAHVVASGGRAG